MRLEVAVASNAIWKKSCAAAGVCLLLEASSAVGAAVTDVVTESEAEIVRTVTAGLLTTGVSVILVEIPEKPDVSPLENGEVPEADERFSSIAIGLSLSPVRRIEALRGSADRRLFVHSMPSFSRPRLSETFAWRPGTEWILFLESPFVRAHESHDRVMASYRSLKAEQILTEQNFFTVFDSGYGALCVRDRLAESRPGGPTVMPKGLLADLRTLLALAADDRTTVDQRAARSAPKRLKTGLGRAVLAEMQSLTGPGSH